MSVRKGGITPAHAGKSVTRVPVVKPLKGSPPHTRGKVLRFLAIMFAGRITPAHAGKRTPSFLSDLQRRDHPRTRGEKFLFVAFESTQ